MSDQCPVFAHFLGFGGVASAMILSTIGAAYGTAKSGVGISGLATFKPELVMKSLIPIIMSGILAVYGLVVSVLIAGSLSPSEPYSLFAGCTHLAAGLACGGSGLAAGLAIGKAGDAFVRAYVYQSRVYVESNGVDLPYKIQIRWNASHLDFCRSRGGLYISNKILTTLQVLGLYGLIVALILNTRISGDECSA
ncbi:hypothetical protein E3Q23_04231 [Wallemia mellicola]|uniref:V-type proton ATPase proteolipid subunit n=1 Tax=Wallemia mellicola TaxID=1708541 RepID=A0AB74K8B3_9BASI|nr:hypothetical protein E3Q24_04184 [Wallemia mellicola]TIB70229.1 hypothetical protein E3Q23_04231 [Wallemia mellicola]TIB79131.1 V-type ATPase [Wallemia mellicola]TIB83291.1 V-type ATPase [Wallemia mellicola]TIB85312.1 V-type ATPase [Wallemia mellicola]